MLPPKSTNAQFSTASRVAKITGDAVQYLDDNFFKVDSAVYTGSKACQGCGHGLLRVTRGTTTVALGLLDRADVLLSGRITNAKVAIAGYEKQAVEYGQSKNYRRIVGAYQWLKENAQYVMFAPAQKLD